MERLKYVADDNLLKSCKNLEQSLRQNENSDIDGHCLYMELTASKFSLPIIKAKRAIDMLNYLKKLDDYYPNAYVAYIILLTIPVIFAYVEKSFSMLKLIKTYLRSIMSCDRINRLTMIC